VPCFERGNAYYVDQPWSRDGEILRNQVKKFFDRLAYALDKGPLSGKRLLNETLTANFCPFNSDTWRTFPKAERRRAISLSRELWGRILRRLSPRVIICMGGIPYREFRRLFRKMSYEFSSESIFSSGWGAVNFRLVDCRESAGSPRSSTCHTCLRLSSCAATNLFLTWSVSVWLLLSRYVGLYLTKRHLSV
jgi:hypothetical protein